MARHICNIGGNLGNARTVTMEMLYNKLATVERKVTEIEYAVLPEVELSAEDKRKLSAIRQEMRSGRATPLLECLKKKA